jgi:hypothetical protein
MALQKEIILQNTATGIMAIHLSNGYPDGELRRLFGTHIIPTPFRGPESMGKALIEIQRLNPDAAVSASWFSRIGAEALTV